VPELPSPDRRSQVIPPSDKRTESPTLLQIGERGKRTGAKLRLMSKLNLPSIAGICLRRSPFVPRIHRRPNALPLLTESGLPFPFTGWGQIEKEAQLRLSCFTPVMPGQRQPRLLHVGVDEGHWPQGLGRIICVPNEESDHTPSSKCPENWL